MPFLLSSQSNKVGKSPEANTGMRRHTSPAHEALPHLPCRESSPSRPGGGSSDQVPRASGGGPRACNSTLSGAGSNSRPHVARPAASFGALLGGERRGRVPLPGLLLQLSPVGHLHSLSQNVSGTRLQPEVVRLLFCPGLQGCDASGRPGSLPPKRTCVWGQPEASPPKLLVD